MLLEFLGFLSDIFILLSSICIVSTRARSKIYNIAVSFILISNTFSTIIFRN